MWRVSSRSGVATLRTAIIVTYLLAYVGLLCPLYIRIHGSGALIAALCVAKADLSIVLLVVGDCGSADVNRQ